MKEDVFGYLPVIISRGKQVKFLYVTNGGQNEQS